MRSMWLRISLSGFITSRIHKLPQGKANTSVPSLRVRVIWE